MKEKLDNESFVKKMFKKYYVECEVEPPRDYEKREYAFTLSKKGEIIRHKSFEDWKDFRDFLNRNAPLHVFYSSAYYLQPSAPDMDAKEWIGADLIFDIDVDHIYTPCKEDHDKWTCLDCGLTGSGMPRESCPQCLSKRIDVKAWFCERCLEVAKEETVKLVEDFLIQDFGFSPKEISIAFSGRRGFHVHVESDVVRELDQRARREIVDYVKGTGLAISGKKRKALAPPLSARGWPGRIAKGVYEILNSYKVEDLTKILGIKMRPRVEEAIKIIIESLERSKNYWTLDRTTHRIWFEAVKKAVENKRCEIDERVTTDIKRLIRLPGSLHGGTGLIVMKVALRDLDSFDPYIHAVAFSRGEVRVKVLNVPKITFLNQDWGPYQNEVVELPLGLAIYLLCSDNAIIDWVPDNA